ncbi:hypothetical protein CEXT_563131 [Caerostris extrusa]|uniref:Uncharacterized protein n=1 Tax=Caerostris extrusa TaxID=172846 RepID=A0AAV4WES6_CAEEX|nr:hypothetical protein CEXT_563131 [Caerostris extrusa]
MVGERSVQPTRKKDQADYANSDLNRMENPVGNLHSSLSAVIPHAMQFLVLQGREHCRPESSFRGNAPRLWAHTVPAKRCPTRERRRTQRPPQLDLRLLCVAYALVQSEIGRADGHAGVRVGLHVLGEGAREHALPVLLEPRIPYVGVGRQVLHVVVELGDLRGVQLHRDGPLCRPLQPLHQLLLLAPSVAGHPGEDVLPRPHGGPEHPGGVLCPGEENHATGADLLQQVLVDGVEDFLGGRVGNLLVHGDADVPAAGLLLEGRHSGVPVLTLRRHQRHVRPVKLWTRSTRAMAWKVSGGTVRAKKSYLLRYNQLRFSR